MKQNTIRTNSMKAWLLAARPKTLTGAAVPVMIGTALAYTDSTEIYSFNHVAAILCFLFAFVMQINANLINDFFDYMKGTDKNEERLGPRRACAQGWITTDAMKKAIITITVAACIIGLPLTLFGGYEMILIGIICIVFCFLYTTHMSYIGLGDILVVVFFGIIPVCITYYIQTRTCTLETFIMSIASGLVTDALLIVNNFRDRDTDRNAGKNTLVVRIGPENSLKAYLYIGLTAFFMGSVFLINGRYAAFAMPAIYLVMHIITYRKMKRIYKGKALNMCLADTARNIFIYGLCVSVGLMLQ
ncbi:1,4-dihydroxy-2-naphthoate octaprenyltransferase [Xylanibacter muris]|uniref:1,4-dihydroxy-2-naphthoate octaprenyltransferase n=1 Tax=Xylanibacter muris TaxID=2736290 RepID=A0ABX2APF3_9BACT|nr:1,4-dihydroxy-2-naphthoate octaprenyltransferase [Xylanibacter muris]NPD92859.1 1,4-dihydroxy-2-naphthoate octaprenyltransferase [Xylanibacter muris]